MSFFDSVVEVVTHPKVLVLAAGAAGAFVYLLHEGRELTLKARVATIFGGMIAAHFLTGPAVRVFDLHSVDSDGGGTGFVIGLFAMSIIGAVIRISKEIDWAAIRSFLPGGK